MRRRGIKGQLKRLRADGIPDDVTYVDGRNGENLVKCMRSLQSGDTLVVDGIEVLHNTTDGVHDALRDLAAIGVNLRMLDDERTIAAENLADVRLGIQVRHRLTAERHRYDSTSGREAAYKLHGRISKDEMKDRWLEKKDEYPTIAEALHGTGWTQKAVEDEFGKRGTRIQRKKR